MVLDEGKHSIGQVVAFVLGDIPDLGGEWPLTRLATIV
jgi:hypothetical protein